MNCGRQLLIDGGLGGGNGLLSAGLGDMQMNSAVHKADTVPFVGDDSGRCAVIETGEPLSVQHLEAVDTLPAPGNILLSDPGTGCSAQHTTVARR